MKLSGDGHLGGAQSLSFWKDRQNAVHETRRKRKVSMVEYLITVSFCFAAMVLNEKVPNLKYLSVAACILYVLPSFKQAGRQISAGWTGETPPAGESHLAWENLWFVFKGLARTYYLLDWHLHFSIKKLTYEMLSSLNRKPYIQPDLWTIASDRTGFGGKMH